ncbi:hypothetical protein, partial [Gelidibacter sediminis]|uniref:hypothetical protein n=1 Tax=Gelidibacter sediminis TaxID=1608710 RepID=UPI0014151042
MSSSILFSQNIQGVTPTVSPKGGFAVDGGAYAGEPASFSTIGDFFYKRGAEPNFADTATSPGGLFYKDPTAPFGYRATYPNTFFFRDDITTEDPSVFDTASKIDDNPNTYKWKKGSSPTKNELQTTIVHFTNGDPAIGGNADDLWVIFAADREDTDGSSYIDFEFLQKPLTLTGAITPTNTSGGFISEGTDGGRTINDILVTVEFTKGGVAANVVVLRWEPKSGGGFEYKPFTGFPAGSILASNNNLQTIVPYPIYDQPEIAPGQYQYLVNQYAEGAVNLTALFSVADPCFNISTLFIRTRTSGSSGSAQLKDFPTEGPIQLIEDLTPISDIVATSVCVGQPITLTASSSLPATNYKFFIDANENGKFDTGETVLQNGASNVYSDVGLTLTADDVVGVLVLTSLGCEDASTTGLTYYNTPNVEAGPNKELTCTTTSINLSGSSTTANVSYAWIASDGGHIVSGADSATPLVDMPGTYTLTVTSAEGCTATDLAYITIDDITPTANAGADVELTCTVTSMMLTGIGDSTNPDADLVYAWSGPSGYSASTAQITVSVAGDYTLRVTDNDNGCYMEDTVTVGQNSDKPTADAGADVELTCTTTSVMLTGVGDSTNPDADLVYAWSGPSGYSASTAQITVSVAGDYTLRVTDNDNGCYMEDTVTVGEDKTVPTADAGADTELT